jgi:hypothetical protein
VKRPLESIHRPAGTSDFSTMNRYKASTAQPRVHLDLATCALRAALREQIRQDGAGELPDWSTLRIWGPFEVFSQKGEIRYEYRGLVDTLKTQFPARALAG